MAEEFAAQEAAEAAGQLVTVWLLRFRVLGFLQPSPHVFRDALANLSIRPRRENALTL